MSQPRPAELAERLLQGDRRALARVLSLLEDGGAAARELASLLYSHGGRAYVVGVTGAPGTGKSTLVNTLARAYRERGSTVGILAVDPTSPFTGGALLGDRVRMRDLAGDPGVFIRSTATRGGSGGLPRVAADIVHALDAAGFERIFIETVGAGQDEVEVARLAHTVIVVDSPGLGDEIQAIKAGILEIAHILVVNKADREGAEQTLTALRLMLELAAPAGGGVSHHGQAMAVAGVEAAPAGRWQPPVLPTVATEAQGTAAVLEAIEAHRAHLDASGERAGVEAQRAQAQLSRALDEALRQVLAERLDGETYQVALAEVMGRQADPHTVARRLVEWLRQTAGRPAKGGRDGGSILRGRE